MPGPDCSTTSPDWPYGFGVCHCGCGQKTNIIPRSNPKRGYVKGQPYQFVQYHTPLSHEPPAARLARMSEPGPGGCILWTGSTNNGHLGGYGRTTTRDATGRIRSVYAHRLAWEVAFGPVPKGMNVCHRCDVPRCINPDHLFLGTTLDNHLDMVAKGRWPRRPMKVSDADVERIKLLANAGVPQALLAQAYGITQQHVSALARGKYRRKIA